jgi:hypothetical protein
MPCETDSPERDNTGKRRKEIMRLNISATALAAGILWGAAVLIVGIANLAWPGYGVELLRLLASIYPGYKAAGSMGDLIIGAFYSLVDGALFGLLFAWLYNRFLGDEGAIPSRVKQEAGVRYPSVEPKS